MEKLSTHRIGSHFHINMPLLMTCVKVDIFPRPFATGLGTGFGGLKNVWFKSAVLCDVVILCSYDCD